MKVTFETPGGGKREVEARSGLSLMEIAVNASVEGIDGECGGGCSCATCHVIVADKWVEKLQPAEEYERDLIDCLENAEPNSRLSCQIRLSPAMDGLEVKVPESQGI